MDRGNYNFSFNAGKEQSIQSFSEQLIAIEEDYKVKNNILFIYFILFFKYV